jgi:hypothetical protein
MALKLSPPADSLKDDDARFMAHVVAIGAVVTLFTVLATTLTLISIWYWG